MRRIFCALFILAASCSALLFVGACATREVRVVRLDEEPHAYFKMIKFMSQLVEVMDVPDRDKYGFLVIEGETPNAYSLQDHTIAVDRTLIDIFTDDELMCVLAHEIAHISLGHHAKKTAVSKSKSLAFERLDKASGDGGVLSLMLKPFSVKAFSREQEIEADVEAARAIRLFGISPERCVTALLKLEELASKSGYRKGGGPLDTHPSLDERIRKIREFQLQ